MPDDEQMTVAVPHEIADAYAQYLVAQSARARWAEEERRNKEKILTFLGYDDDDEKPLPATVVAPSGVEMFRVSIGHWRGLDFQYFKAKYPDIYAECERSKATKALKPPG